MLGLWEGYSPWGRRTLLPLNSWEPEMLKIKAELDGRTVVMLGLSFGNLDKFRAKPGDTYIRIDGKEMDLPIDIMLFSGETEMKLMEMVASFIGPDTKLNIDSKLKS
jgi:hypothetical protein